MSQASIIINVGPREQMHNNGLSGTFTVPGKKAGEDFAILVVYPVPEIQDIGDNRKVVHWLKASPIAHDIVGIPRMVGGTLLGGTDAAAHSTGVTGSKEKWGLLLCQAEPDVPKELLAAVEEEIEYLTLHRTRTVTEFDPVRRMNVAVSADKESVMDKKEELSLTVQVMRDEFTKACRSLVTASELAKARHNLQVEDQRLMAEGDLRWAAGEGERKNINNLHREACGRMGQERPWAYVPMQLIACPGCGSMIRENILQCPSCQGWLDDGVPALALMPPKERAIKMYPSRYEREPVAATGTGKGK